MERTLHENQHAAAIVLRQPFLRIRRSDCDSRSFGYSRSSYQLPQGPMVRQAWSLARLPGLYSGKKEPHWPPGGT